MFSVFMIFDSKAEAYMQPFFALTRGMAIRIIMKATADPASDFHRFAADYTLFECGKWDPQAGKFDMMDAFVSIDNLVKYKEMADG